MTVDFVGDLERPASVFGNSHLPLLLWF
jgi:hypothetical protein